jgi:hypothetical protein
VVVIRMTRKCVVCRAALSGWRQYFCSDAHMVRWRDATNDERRRWLDASAVSDNGRRDE